FSSLAAEAQLLTALEDSRVQLSCDIRAPGPGDFPVRILWFKDLSPSPVYSVEVNSRTGSLSQVRQSAQLSGLQGRAYFSVIQVPAVLSIDGLRHSDNGTYVCAVDFKKDWTRKLTTHLIVIGEPLRRVLIPERARGLSGPPRRVSRSPRNCDAESARLETVPSGMFFYLFSQLGVLVSSRTFSSDRVPNVLRAERSRPNVPETHAPTKGAPLGEPESVSPQRSTQLFRRHRRLRPQPTSLLIWAQVRPIKGLITCHSRQYSLSKNGMQLSSASAPLASCRKISRPVVRCPLARRGGASMIGSESMLYIRLNSADKPVVQLKLGSGLNPASIHEGIDIYFECTVRANPGVSEVSWQFNRKDLHTDGGRGVIVSNQSLALRSVNRTNSGFYACLAANTEGEAESNRLKLRVLHAPACRSPQRQYSHAVAKHETVEVSCDVEADPQDVSFAWSFHQGHRNLKLATNAFSATTPNRDSNSARSVLLYTPKTDADYGSLFCLARNAVGESAEPCVFQVIPVGPPMTPFNCTVEEVTSESVHVTCQRSG
ncbi:unnamed protein product, partial [Ixodes persulcatus]